MHLPRINPKISVSIVFVAAMFMSIMDSTIVNVALPSLSRQFNVTGTAIDAVVVGYLVSLAVVIPASGWLGDRFGTKRVFLISLALFSIASALCGLATSLPMLIGFRVLQGLAGGALTPVGTALLYRTFPPAERVQVSRILNIPTALAPAMGPVLGGLLIDKLSWNWVFYVNVPIGIVSCLFGLFFLTENSEHKTRDFDVLGFVLAGVGLALTMYALSEGPNDGWTAPGILISGIVGVLILIAFVIVELRVAHPMLDLRLFSNRAFRVCNLLSLFSGAGFMGLLYAAPIFLQEGRGATALTSGLTTFPEALGVLVSTQIVGRLYPTLGPRRLILTGLSGVSIFMLLMCLMGQDTSLWFMRVLMFLIGAGMACAFLPVQTAGFATITSAQTGQASALNNAQRQVGASLGVALISSIISIVGMTTLDAHGVAQPNLNAYHAAFITSAILIIIATGISLLIRDSEAAATMRKSPLKEQPTSIDEAIAAAEASI
ncbi:DHA2 family efflux MFS transporter permease subunit [Ktedonospora formicarum]|uniref:MFS transporter n=1 Tax=Ktedonospora formicarum TaxID=2778364 RepID=A0A8J3I3C8_9CHLR|nr:DHA2 family efflux MFS transporter permease subunit [Ktedonospora formicarum]GHO46831.1 MFS transporter [Ktedonospora formicarum]